MDNWTSDLRAALRSLRRSPGFLGLAAGILAVAIGANAAFLGAVKSVLVDGLPVEDPDRLVAVWLSDPESGQRARMTPGHYTDLSTLTSIVESQAAFSGVSGTLLEAGEPVVLRGGRVTAGYLDTLGVTPVMGRSFLPGEDRAGEPSVVILSHRVWRQYFGADPAAIGGLANFDGVDFEIVGVLPPGVYPTSATLNAEIPFAADNQDFLVPLRYQAAFWSNRGPHIIGTIARLRSGVPDVQVAAALETLAARVAREDPNRPAEAYVVRPFREEVFGQIRLGMLLLMGAVGLVLLIAATNVGALFVLRTDDRRAEFGVRGALGAPKRRLMRQLLFESGAVALVGCVGGIFVATWVLDAMKRLVPFHVPRLADAALDGPVVMMTLAVGVLLTAVIGVTTALGATRSSQQLTSGLTRGSTAGPGRRPLHRWAVGIQAALTVVVLIAATLSARSFLHLRSVDPGFAIAGTWVLPLNTGADDLALIIERVRSLPGVATASLSYDHPLERNWEDGIEIDGQPPLAPDERRSAALRPIRGGYFDTTGIPLVEGRGVEASDETSGFGVAVVNETFVARYLSSGRAIGQRVRVPSGARLFGEGLPEWYEIVGVAGDVRFLGPEHSAEPALYLPEAQFPSGASKLIIRPSNADVDVFPTVRAAIREMSPTLPLDNARRLQDLLDELVAGPRFSMVLLSSFALLALTLCALGIYGLVSRVVAARTREICIRTALGARRGWLLGHVASRALGPAAAGTAAGLVASGFLASRLQVTLFGVAGLDPVTFTAVPAFVVGMATLAAVVPLRRALAIDPAKALRES